MAKKEEVEVNVTTKGVDDMNKHLKDSQEAAKGLADDFGLANSKAGQVFNSVVTGAKKGVVAMKTLKGAIAATGIGLLAIAVASLVSYFTKTESGAQSLRKAMAFLGAIFDKLQDVLVGIGRGLVNLKDNFTSFGDLLKKGFQAILQNIINRFVAILDIAKAIGKLFKGDFKEGLKDLADGTVKLTTGVADFTDKVAAARDKTAEWVKEVRDAAKAAQDLADRENKLKVQQREWLVEQAKLEVALSEARLKTGDATKTAAERIAALNEAQRIQNEISDKQVQMAREAYEIQKEKNGLASSTEDDLQQEAQLQADLIRIEKERNDRNKEFVDQRAGLLNAELEKERAAAEEKKKLQEEADKLAEEKALAEVERRKTVLAQIEELEKQAAAMKQAREDEAYLASITNEEEREAARIELMAKRREEALALEDEQFEEDLARKLEKQEILESEVQGIRDAYAELRLQKENGISADVAKAEAELAKKRIDMEKTVQESKIEGTISAAQAVLGAANAVFGESKASAIAETIINTYQSATAAFKSLAGIPVVGPALGGIAAAAAVVAGLANLAKIKSSSKPSTAAPQAPAPLPNKNPMQEGGWIGGSPHSQGGTWVNAEANEFIVSKRTMESGLGGLVVAANRLGNAGGGNPNQLVSDDRIAEIAAKVVGSIPVYVVENSITDKQRQVQIRESAYVR